MPDPTVPQTSSTDRRRGLVYPSPFFDVAQSYMPPTVKELFKWCAYFFYTDPIIGAGIIKIAEYPITDFVYASEDEHVRDKWKEVLETTLNIKPFLIEVGLDFFTFGNCFISINLPFKRLLKCPKCEAQTDITNLDYKFKKFSFYYACPSCKEDVVGHPVDVPIKNTQDINFIRWDPKNIDIEFNPLTGKSRYRYRVPNKIRRAITQGRKELIGEIPWVFIQAVKENKDVILNKRNLFHFKRPTLAEQDQGWGKPLILHSLKRLYYVYVLRRAQEAIALQRILPLEFVFPQANATQDPYCCSLTSLVETRDGLKPAGEVKEGDYLKSHTGAWRRVEGAINRDVRSDETVYDFKVAGLTAFPFGLSEEHPILASKRPGKSMGFRGFKDPDWVFAKDVQKGDLVCYPTYRQTWKAIELDLHEFCPERSATRKYIYRRLNQQSAEIYEWFESNGVPTFENGERQDFLAAEGWDEANYANAREAYIQRDTIDRRDRYLIVTKELAYTIGAYAANGSPSQSLATISLHKDKTHVMDLIEHCCAKHNFGHSTRTTNDNTARVVINDVFLSELLVKCCNKGAQNKRLPDFILEAPRDIAIAAVKGLYDGDGCSFETETKRAGLKTTSPQLAMDAWHILVSEGVIPTIQKATPREDEIAKLPYYQVNCNGPQKDALNALFEGRYAPEPSRCGFIRGDYLYLRVEERTIAKDIKVVRGFQMAVDKSFCVAGVATHNSHVNLHTWSARVEGEIQKWRVDPNYISVIPVPLGFERLGGDGRALLLGPELEIANKEIASGMGIPLEFLMGGLSWSGSSVSLRTLENHFLLYRRLLLRFLKFVKDHLRIHLGLPDVDVKFTEFKMADDVQRKQIAIQLNAAQKLSTETLLTELGWEHQKEQRKIAHEIHQQMEIQEEQMKAQARAQGEVQVLSVKYQMQAHEAQMKMQQQMQQQAGDEQQVDEQGNPIAPEQQQVDEQGNPIAPEQQAAPQPQDQTAAMAQDRELAQEALAQSATPSSPQANTPGERKQLPGGSGNVVQFDVDAIAKRWATKIMQLPVAQQRSVLSDLMARMPSMYQVVLQYIGMTPAGGTAGAMKPLPEKLPPRRQQGPI